MSTAMFVQWEVVERLQNEIQKALPGCDLQQILEHALDMLLNGTRTQQDPNLLYRDVLRNARYSFYRSKQRGHIAGVRYCNDLEITVQDGVIDIADTASIEDSVTAGAFLDHLRMGAAQLGDHGWRLLELLVRGQNVTQAATMVKISRATAYRSLTKLREHANAWYGLAA